jgi:hypothetical protein
MSYVGADFAPPSDPGEVEWYAFDFSAILASGETISTATWLIEVVYPTGSSAPSVLSVPAVNGSVVAYLVPGLCVGAAYRFTATVTTSQGATKSLYSHMYCQAPN